MLLRGAAAIRKLFPGPAPDVDLEAGRRQLDGARRELEADLAEARRRRTRQTHERLREAAVTAEIRHEHADEDLQYAEGRRRESRNKHTERRVNAALDAWHTTARIQDRTKHRLLVYERAARTVGIELTERALPRHSPPYSPSLEQLTAEADRQVAREHQGPDRRRPRSEATPAPTSAPRSRTRPPVRSARPTVPDHVPETPAPPSHPKPPPGVKVDVPPENPVPRQPLAGSTRSGAPAPAHDHNHGHGR